MSKIENGFLLPTPEDVIGLGRVYRIPEAERESLVALAVGLREKSSARVILARGVAETQRRIGLLESSASLVRSFQPCMVIGLLQTTDYMRCVFGQPDSHELSPGEIDDAVAAREARQAIFADEGRQFICIMTEGALRWQAGSGQVMTAQLEAIVTIGKRPNVRVGIIPWTTPVGLFPRGGFHLYDDDAVIVATEVATATMTAEADIATYTEMFAALEDIAAFGDEAEKNLARIGAEYRHLAR